MAEKDIYLLPVTDAQRKLTWKIREAESALEYWARNPVSQTFLCALGNFHREVARHEKLHPALRSRHLHLSDERYSAEVCVVYETIPAVYQQNSA